MVKKSYILLALKWVVAGLLTTLSTACGDNKK